MPHAYLDHKGILAFAHRGDHSAGPENTMPAFAGAVAMGFSYIETDVHCTRDGVLLAFHDDRLDRVTDSAGVIANLPFAVVGKARVDGTEPIPLLEDVLDAFPDTRFNIDLKADNTVSPFVEFVKRTRCQDRICVGSFSDRRIAFIRREFPEICTSMGPREVLRARLSSFRLPLGKFSAACSQVPVNWNRLSVIDDRFVNAMRARNIQVHVWTINDSDEMQRLLDLGIDGIMTDYPHILKTILVERQLWS